MTILLALFLLSLPAAQAAPDADSLARLVAKDRADTGEWLKGSPTSYLATVHRVDFGDRTTLIVGSGSGSDVRINDPTITVRHLRVSVEGDSFRVTAEDPGAFFIHRKDTLRSALIPPSQIATGRFLLRLSHQRYPGIIVYDPKSPRFAEYKGLKYFPYDPAYRYILPLLRNPNPDTTIILSTRGNRRKALRVGWFEFTAGGTPCRLEVSRLLEPGVGEESYSIFFRDGTSGVESYPMGRYVEAEELDGGMFLVDFNMTYNPACAFSEHYNCPIPPEANHLRARIPAGEMDAHYLEH
jgi:hypothetical protein